MTDLWEQLKQIMRSWCLNFTIVWRQMETSTRPSMRAIIASTVRSIRYWLSSSLTSCSIFRITLNWCMPLPYLWNLFFLLLWLVEHQILSWTLFLYSILLIFLLGLVICRDSDRILCFAVGYTLCKILISVCSCCQLCSKTEIEDHIMKWGATGWEGVDWRPLLSYPSENLWAAEGRQLLFCSL